MDTNFVLIAIEPPTLHKIHFGQEAELLPLCGTQSGTGFECVGDTATDGFFHLNTCERCRRAVESLRAVATHSSAP